jgi:hypothetical protein
MAVTGMAGKLPLMSVQFVPPLVVLYSAPLTAALRDRGYA